MRDLPLCQEIRNYPKHRPTGPQHGIGEHTHHAIAAAAVDQPDSRLRQPHAELPRRLGECRVAAKAGATKYRDRCDLLHERQPYGGLRQIRRLSYP